MLGTIEAGDRIVRRTMPRVILLTLIHAILLYNALNHDPRVGYDAEEHLEYIEVLSKLSLPTPEQTYEFISPPLPYVVPALARALGMSLTGAAKVGQVVNVFASLFLMYHLLAIADMLRPGHERLKLLALGLLGTLPVYYKSFAFVRGEPLLAAMAVAVAHEAIAIFVRDDRSVRRALALGVWLGLAVLSRQLGYLLLPPLAFLVIARIVAAPRLARFLLGRSLLAGAATLLVCGPFLAHMAIEHGSIAVYSRPGFRSFSLANNPPSFYFDPGLDKVFADPVRDAFPNRLLPTFYSEVWGDYWCYFLIYGYDARNGNPLSGLLVNRALSQPELPEWLRTNRESIAPYLGRVNAAALPASAVMAGGMVMGLIGLLLMLWRRRADSEILTRSFLFLIVVSTLGGLLWILIKYSSPSVGRMIKPTYALQLFPFLCLLAAEAIVRLDAIAPRAARWLCVLLVACALHNLPALFTRVVVR